MRPTFITDEATQEPAVFMALARDFALDAVELRSVLDRPVAAHDDAVLRDLARELEAARLGVCCLGSPVFKCDFDEDLAAQLATLDRWLAAARLLGCPLVRVFSFWRRPTRPPALAARITATLQLAVERARAAGVRLVVENGKRSMHATGAELRALLDDLDATVCGALWDPGNCIYGGTDPDPVRHGFPLVAPRVWHVHIKDPDTYAGGRAYVPLGQGQLDLPGQIQALAARRYRGYVSLETHWRPTHVLSEEALDRPGGASFSKSGYDATASSLAVLVEACTRSVAAG